VKGLPIRLRLTLWYCAMFATAASLLSVSSWWMLRHSLMATEYHELQERAEDVQLLLVQLGPRVDAKVLQERFTDIYQVKDDGKYLQVLDQDGRWIFRSKRLVDEGLQPALPGALPARGTLTEFHQGTRFVRVLSYPIKANGRAYAVQTGIALNKSLVLLSVFRAQLLLLTPAVLLLAAIGGHFMSRKALAPVAAIATEARRINDRNLEIRLPIATTHDEISHLSETLNQMLERVELGVRSIRDFTANAAHELRTPLALIRTEVEVALSLPRSAAEYREACEQVQLETVRMTALIDNLLMLARADSKAERLRYQLIEANQLVRRLGDKWKHAMRLGMLNFSLDTINRPVFVWGDVDTLQRLLTILLDNAVRYTLPGGAVCLKVALDDGRLTFTVHDTGIGIAPGHQPRVFDRFYRVDRTRGGSGLGLALANWIAAEHGTCIFLESTFGKGSSFHFSLPEADLRLINQGQPNSSEKATARKP
jgi:two-component system, OmpR family, heavy metal sensor histidine kinase CusS